MAWRKLPLLKSEMCLSKVLRSGQAFRWRNIDGIWSCALNNQIVLLRENPDTSSEEYIEYMGIPEIPNLNIFLNSYFNLNVSIIELHQHWSNIDKNFQFKEESNNALTSGLETPPKTPEPLQITTNGVRILNQDPWETLVSFIISSNNNIKRISQLCEVLCISYGKLIGYYSDMPYYSFPTPYDLFRLESNNEEVSETKKQRLESELRSLGFGYRAGYIMKTAFEMIKDNKLYIQLKNDQWENDDKCIQFLKQFNGVGPKVADCVALMGCKRDDLVPVDTHVWNILKNKYKYEFNEWVDNNKNWDEISNGIPKSNIKKSLVNKAVNVKMYPLARQFFKDFWVLKAGWAQAIVFADVIKLDNGINNVDDLNKLIDKVSSSTIALPDTNKIKKRKN